MERDKVKVVKDILVDELDIYSDVTIKLVCVDLEVINELRR